MSRFQNWRCVCVLAAALLTSPALAESGSETQPTLPINGAKVSQDIATMKKNGMGANAIKYVLGLDGIEVPDMVLSGRKSVDDAIADGSLRQGTAPSSWSPPPVPPAPTPDLTPKGSSASGWQPSTAIPSIDAMRRAVQSNTRPPRC